MTSDSDYYGILHVNPDAPGEVIRASYRTLLHALRIHPDLGGDTAKAAAINQAYRVLSDPVRRAEYDRRLRNGDPDGYGFGPDPSLAACLFCRHPVPADAVDAPDATCSHCHSPLARATRHRLEHSTRRMLRRTERRLPAFVYTDAEQARPIRAMMQNLSLNGMRFESPKEFGPNQLIRIDTEPCRTLARVTHCQGLRPGLYSTGVEFVTIVFSSAQGTFVSEHA